MVSRNYYSTSSRSAGVPRFDPLARLVWRGWCDFRSGSGFPEDYERMTQQQHGCYEAGRRVAAALSHYGPLPAWPAGVMFPEIFTEDMPQAAVTAALVENQLTEKGAVS